MDKIKDFCLCLLSFFLLLLAFPKTDWAVCAWIGLVPWMLAMDEKPPIAAFGRGYFLGVLFFAGTLYWFIHVTVPGAALLTLYLAVYFGLFGFGYAFFSSKNVIEKIFLIPSLWVGLEFIRGWLFTGFGWVNLGHSQYKNLPFIQIADLTGVPGISFLVVMVNVVLKEYIKEYVRAGSTFVDRNRRRELFLPGVIVMGLVGLCWAYGFYWLHRPPLSSHLRVTVIQGNIPQELKWEESLQSSIVAQYLALTTQAVSEKPELIIWPETAFPGFIAQAPGLFEFIKDSVRSLKIPLLLGALTEMDSSYHNSAILLSQEGEIIGQHNKLHLVPFGEYIPLRHYLSFLEDIIPISDFTSGDRYTLFALPPQDNAHRKQKQPFAVLICFEDTLARLSREFVRRGAGLLVNVTNDAWFEDTKAPFLHLQAAVFRTIENRRSLVRAANTGVSCFIDPYGRIINQVEDHKQKSTYVAGHATQSMDLNTEKTFYTKHGDAFAYLCFGCILWGIFGKRRKLINPKISLNPKREVL